MASAFEVSRYPPSPPVPAAIAMAASLLRRALHAEQAQLGLRWPLAPLRFSEFGLGEMALTLSGCLTQEGMGRGLQGGAWESEGAWGVYPSTAFWSKDGWLPPLTF